MRTKTIYLSKRVIGYAKGEAANNCSSYLRWTGGNLSYTDLAFSGAIS
jgi:hypothetical protein